MKINKRRRKTIDKCIKKEYNNRVKKNKSMFIDEDGFFCQPYCSGCGDELDLGDEYSMRYGFCSVTCGLKTVGMSWSDFC